MEKQVNKKQNLVELKATLDLTKVDQKQKKQYLLHLLGPPNPIPPPPRLGQEPKHRCVYVFKPPLRTLITPLTDGPMFKIEIDNLNIFNPIRQQIWNQHEKKRSKLGLSCARLMLSLTS